MQKSRDAKSGKPQLHNPISPSGSASHFCKWRT